ncbi:NAD-dependent epimerase/dehydratase family protein [Candidatus Uabimicrobium amorphum]|uniref:Oxidoreductase n=1 Tax=Uabimicrobium amorphum TaxID=2596890 RepID=A0A5S9IQU9_UABAM|nr:NAD(P)-dependent oxidoreductase [Candidatus Uabimicrobium amorphum]BBM86037.1 oxidoreductase [Candidatus Uabimicrobium amorphum]
MKILVTGSAGHLGEALMRTLRNTNHDVCGIDIKESPFTDKVVCVTDRKGIAKCMEKIDVVMHTATLHKPHVSTHTRQNFIDTNITGTLNLLEEAVKVQAKAFIFTSTTSVFGRALRPNLNAPAVWVDESLTPVSRNIYGTTKFAAENLCELFHYKFKLPGIVLRTSRFFLEEDDNAEMRNSYISDNIKVNEYLYRRVDIADIVDAHILAMEKASRIGFERYIISATTPFTKEHLCELHKNAPQVVARLLPDYSSLYRQKNWKMFPRIERVYVNKKAREQLGWQPRYDFAFIIGQLKNGEDFRSPLALEVGIKGYHEEKFVEGPFPVERDTID